MMKKLTATLLMAALLLTGTALAANHDANGIAFEYDDTVFEVAVDELDEEEAIVVLYAVDETLENTFVSISLAPLIDGETFPTLEEYIAETNDFETEEVNVEQLDEWLGYKDVYSYAYDVDNEEDGRYHSETYTAPVTVDGEVKAVLEIYANQDAIDDEDVSTHISDAISGVLDSLKVTVE